MPASPSKPLPTPLALLLAFSVCAIAFYTGPWALFADLTLMPGNLGDARLNAYFLENVYLYLTGDSASLWHLPIFYPAPYALGFSDNLFGSAPIYAGLRALGLDAYTSYQWWFLIAYPLNYAAAVYAGRRLGLSWLGAIFTGLVFAFALPVVAQADHSQLQYRCAVPIAIVAWLEFLRSAQLRPLAVAIVAVAVQMLMGVYIGFFALVLMAGMLAAQSLYPALRAGRSTRDVLSSYSAALLKAPKGFWLLFAGALATMIWLFYPYIQAKGLYEVSRSWGAIRSMLPRLYSYLLADHSTWWPSASWALSDLPMRHEHQLFPGLAVLILSLYGTWLAIRRRTPVYRLLGFGLVTVVGLTLFIGWHVDGKAVFANSFWQLFHSMPLASAIRAMARVILILLLPMGCLAAFSIERGVAPRWRMAVFAAALLFTIWEASAVQVHWQTKAAWAAQIDDQRMAYPDLGPADAPVLFVAQKEVIDLVHELDAMWLAAERGFGTVNGYSGDRPDGFRPYYFQDCRELPRRVLLGQRFAGEVESPDYYRQRMAAVRPLGFEGCNPAWWQQPPPEMTWSEKPYSDDQLSAVKIEMVGKTQLASGAWRVDLELANTGTEPIAALAPNRHFPRLEWVFLAADGTKISDFAETSFLPEDLLPGQKLATAIALPAGDARPGGHIKLQIKQRGYSGKRGAQSPPIMLRW